ncbi:MAG: enoyl-CoA hydratase/isomerase family protein [Propionibacteriaceae bacterium]|uniref:3-hydroxyisobutyryl-CoA hydrolase n=1 Tax=Propionibacterium ruminifibrarum TaxID=1962131 RepID=A0A375HYS2_9ACTN|nr:enoyl-CoA hydratase/isomerase family protein [Propionibacterium ruminifibrarum]MBE6477096.1 enoyl-CoA hydratase/isomerase family protein [Propionibacteriaceae bacterium]SPF67713.1 3-hydroxyisobutyryl-CoA hydrolase [Propionibacterium ruminifibrarum]
MSNDVVFEVADGSAVLRLNRPRALNALTTEMFEAIAPRLTAWRDDPSITSLHLYGEGRGFCAGADVRAMRQMMLDGGVAPALEFLALEYATDKLVAGFGKPVTAHLHGIAMGGGLGLSMHGTRRVAAADLAMAMPEVQIGLWPDVGMTWELSRLPGQAGAWLAMTGRTIDAATAYGLGLVDEVEGMDAAPVLDLGWVDECFAGDDPAAILARLESSSDERAQEAGREIRAKSPLSVCVSLAAVRRAASMAGPAEVLDQDLRIARGLLPDCDFVEGVRAQLVDKDRDPHFGHARIEDVDPARVRAIVG